MTTAGKTRGKIRVVIADDSSMARALLRDFLEREDDIEIVGEAGNGRLAVELARDLKPDIITMDLEMPVMSGMEAIEEIMTSKAVPILVVSSVADAHNALVAIGHGALEVVNKPDYSPEQATEFVDKVRMLAGVSVITRMRPRKSPQPPLPLQPPLINHPTQPPPAADFSPAHPAASDFNSAYSHIFAIACSTGGPQALTHILPLLPANFPCPIVIAQHISDGFAGGMADWLGTLCKLPVRLVTEGELLRPGTIYISPSEQHLCIQPNRRAHLLNRAPLDVYRPSCDVLLKSVADVFGRQAIGIILTGMGSDGALGIARIREKGGVTLAQDETSSVIFGMNRVAIESGAVQQVFPVDAIAEAMIHLADPLMRINYMESAQCGQTQ